MGTRDPNFIAIIPARGGSKTIKNKNLISLNGKPLIAYSIEAAKKSRFLNRIIISTDDREIANVAEDYGADVPFFRPDKFAQDNSPDRDVLRHCINWLEQNENYIPEYVAYLRPTTPFKNETHIDNCFQKLRSISNATSLRSITPVEGVFHPYWMYKKTSEFIEPFINTVDPKDYYQRQLLPNCCRLNGVVDILRSSVFMDFNDIYGNNIAYYEIEELEAIDIDTKQDLYFAEYMLSKKTNIHPSHD